MKKFIKFISLICMCVLTTGMLLTGCGEKITPPDKAAEAYFNYVLSGDTTKLKEYGIPSTELESSTKNDVDEIKTSLANDFKSAEFDVTDAEINQIFDGLLSSLKKLTPKIEATDVKGDTATIKITCNYIDFSDMDTSTSDATIKEIESLNITDENQLLDKAEEIFIRNMINYVNNSKPSNDTKEFTFTFKKKQATENGKAVTVWAPEDENKFSDDIVSLLKM